MPVSGIRLEAAPINLGKNADDAPLNIPQKHRPITLDKIPSELTSITTVRENLHKWSAKVNESVQSRYNVSYEQAFASAKYVSDPGVVAKLKTAAELTASHEARKYRDDLLASSEAKNIAAQLEQARDAAARLRNTLAANGSPQHMMSKVGMDTPDAIQRKLQLATWLEGAGKAELANYVRDAMATNDLVGLSAACRALDRIGKANWPQGISPNDIATRIFGDQHRSIAGAAAQAELHLTQVSNIHRDTTVGRRLQQPLDTLNQGVKQHRIDESLEGIEPEGDDE